MPEPASAREHLKVTVYTPDSGLEHPGKLVKDLWADITSASCRDLAWRLIVRNISAMYRKSIMGFMWMFIPPVVQAGIWVFLNDQNVINLGETDIPYPLYVLSGQLIFAGFTQALSAPIGAVRREQALLTKLNFPREALLMAGFGQLMVAVLVPLIVVIPVMVVLKVVPGPAIVLFPFSVALFALFGYSLGLLITPMALFFTDISQTIPIGARFLFFLTPVIYPLPTEGLISKIVAINPVTPMLMVTRDLLTGHEPRMLGYYWAVAGVTAVLLFVGLVMFRLAMPHVVERMSA